MCQERQRLMYSPPLVSVIIIFLNAQDFLEEAIHSVLSQTYKHWELLLVDDGSNDGSTAIAQQLALRRPNQVRYLEHLGHANLGMSASRNLGICHSTGRYIAFLDADDVWLRQKLEVQVDILNSQPEASMVYGNTLYWHSWTERPEDRQRDHIPELGIEPNTLVEPPHLLQLFLNGKAAVPCTCSIMVRRNVMERIGGFEESFRSMYEDQAFYAKICLTESVFVSDECLDCYRQHSNSNCSVAIKVGQAQLTRLTFLKWLATYLLQHHIEDTDLWMTLKREVWTNQPLFHTEPFGRPYHLTRWVKKWMLRLEALILPISVRRRLWVRA